MRLGRSILNRAYKAGLGVLALFFLAGDHPGKILTAKTSSQSLEYKIPDSKAHQKQFAQKESEITEAERYLQEFPENIPGAAKVQKFETPGARYCLVHIKQRHTTALPNHKPSNEEMREINAVQEDIYEILNFLVDNRRTNSVRIEGIVIDDKENPENVPSAEEQVRMEYEARKAESRSEFCGGGAEKLVLERKISAKAADTLEGMIACIKNLKSNTAVFENREDKLLKMIAKERETSAIVVYGGGHAFGGKQSYGSSYDLENVISEKDNIHAWNEINPDDKFCLIEITPKNYKLEIKKLAKKAITKH